MYLEDIIESIEKIEEYTRGLDEDDFKEDSKLQDAVMRRIGIIGEAVKNIPNSFRKKYDEIPWNKIAGMRDIIIHAYFKVDLDIVWSIIKDDLPILKKQIQKVKDDLEKKEKVSKVKKK